MEATNRRRRLSDETRQAVWKRAGLLVWAVVRGILLCGICFVVLFPLFSKVSRSFMAPEDLYNLTVRYIPAHATLQNYRLMCSSRSVFHCWWGSARRRPPPGWATALPVSAFAGEDCCLRA